MVVRFALGLLLTVTVSGLARAEDAASAAARGLLQRRLPVGADHFKFEPIRAEDGRDVFEIESADGKVVIRGNTAVSMATGLNWYLNHYCHCQVSLHGQPPNLPDPLPSVSPKRRKVTWSRYRYFLNSSDTGRTTCMPRTRSLK